MTRTRMGTYLVLAGCLAVIGLGALDAQPADLLRGQVLDAFGEPVVGAQIALRSASGPCFLVPEYSGRRWTTDGEGRFAVPHPPAPMQMRIDHTSLATAWAPAQDGVTVRLDEPAYVECELVAQATVRVRRGAEMLVERSGSGPLLLGPLPPFEFLTVSATSAAIRPAQVTVRLQPGETQRVALRVDSGRRVRGRLSEPIGDVPVRASQGDGRDCVVRTGPDGQFEVHGLREGAVRLIVLAPGQPVRIVDTTAGASVDVEVTR